MVLDALSATCSPSCSRRRGGATPQRSLAQQALPPHRRAAAGAFRTTAGPLPLPFRAAAGALRKYM